MQLTNFVAAALISRAVIALPAHVRRGVDCLFSTAPTSDATCESFSSSWGLTVEEFEGLNPGTSCPRLDINKLYCMIGSVNDDPIATTSALGTSSIANPTTSTTSPPVVTSSSAAVPTSAKLTTVSITTTSPSNGIATPQPTQPGMVPECNKFHFVSQGVSCGQITSYEKITQNELVKWNPSILEDCSGLWGGVNVCVGVVGGAITTTTNPPTTTTAGNGIQTPQPTQPGMTGNCSKFHWVAQGVTCSQIYSYNKITLAEFVRWNPTVDSDCRNMQARVNVCVGIIGGSTTVGPSTTKAKPTSTTTAENNIHTPQPIQTGMVTNCKKFHYVATEVTCTQIISYNKITLADFVKWNTGVGSDCRNMWAKTNVCVGV